MGLEADPPGGAVEGDFATAVVSETLGRSTDVDACVAAARKVTDLVGTALQFFQNAEGAIACQAGCHFCCHLRVMVYPHEAIALHRYLGQMPVTHAQRVRERLTANAAQLRQPAAPARQACAFLLDGQCSAYEVRPAACAGYHSLSREACEADDKAANKPNSNLTSEVSGIPVSQAMRHVAVALSLGLERGLHSLGLPASQVELQTAVAALIQEPALIGRWRSGREWPRDARGRVSTKK